MFDLKPSPEMLRIFAESKALREALAFVDQGGGNATAVRDAVRAAVRTKPTGADGWLIEAAKTKMLTGTVSEPDVSKLVTSAVSTDGQLFQYLGHVWACWAAGNQETARFLLHQLPSGPFTGGALHLMTLKPWQAAIQNLVAGSKDEARRNFKRATEVGSQVGTETSTALQWTYVASFFH